MQHDDKYGGIRWRLALLCLLCVVLCACHKNQIEPTPAPTEEVTLTFSAKLPNAPQGLRTYAPSEANENFIEDIDVLVFTDDGNGDMKFRYRAVGKDISSSGSTAYIKVTLWRTLVSTRLVVIANAREVINAFDFETGITTPDDIQQGLIYSLEGKWPAGNENFKPLPMWGQCEDIEDGISGEVVLDDISLLRSLARVDVVADEDANFELTEVTVFNSKSEGLIIPNSDSPSLPAFTAGDNEVLTYSPLTLNELKDEIYLFEAAAGTESDPQTPDLNATALVIGGKFKSGPPDTSKVYYYRIDFRDEFGSLMPLLRNNRYVIKIKSANFDDEAKHFEDPEGAFQAGSLTPGTIAYKRNDGLKPTLVERSSSPNRSMRNQNETMVTSRSRAINYSISIINESQ